MVLSQGAPLRIRVERRLPALSSFRGHRPAQEIRWPAVGKRLMSMPISATITWAPRLADAGDGGQQLDGGAKGIDAGVDLLSISAMAASRASIWSRCSLQQEAMMVASRARARPPRSFVGGGLDAPMGQGGQRCGIGLPGDQGLEHGATADAQRCR